MIYIDKLEQIDKLKEWLKYHNTIAVDTETTGLDPLTDKILLLQIGNHLEQWVIDAYKIGDDGIKLVLNLIKNKLITKLFHNAIFDYSMIIGNYGIELDNIKCTFITNKLLTNGRRTSDNSLAGVVDKYLNIDLSKTERKSFIAHKYGEPFTPEQIEYAGIDVKYLGQVFDAQMKLIRERKMQTLLALEFMTIKTTADMNLNGIYVDQKKWLALKSTAEKEALDIKLKLDEIFKDHCETDMFGALMAPNLKAENYKKRVKLLRHKGQTVSVKTRAPVPELLNYDSNEQMQHMLSLVLGHPIESTNREYLKTLRHEAIDLLLKYREKRKLVTTYGQEFLNQHVHPKTKRIHSHFDPMGTETGRWSSKNPNMQNIPKGAEYREPFCAQKEGYSIISADFSGQELRLLAHISQEEKFIKAIQENKDLHSYSASLLFGIPYEDFFEKDEEGHVKIDNLGEPVIKSEMKKKYRNPAKSITFGLMYGMGPNKLSRQLDIELFEAKTLFKKYFETFPAIKNLMDELTKNVRERKYAYSPLDGRRRDYTGIDWDNPKQAAGAINAAKNMPFQGCGASVTKLSLIYLRRAIKSKNLDAKILITVHDEVLIEVRDDQAEICAELVKEKMEKAFNYFAPSVPMVVSPQIAKYWVH